MAKIVILVTLLIFAHNVARGVSLMQGQEANMIFPYPCDSTEVTLQQSNRRPFYSLTDSSSLSLPDSQAQRFKVKNLINNGSCSLDLTIKDPMRDDQGTYILFVYKEREILGDHTHRIYLKVDYPPDKALCVVGKYYDRGWITVDCTANAGSLPGKIECYQNGLLMPHLTDPVVRGSLLKQTIIIRKSEPVYCCSSALNEDKSRCECDDTVLFHGVHRKDPCPTITGQMSTESMSQKADNSMIITSLNSTDNPLSSSSNAMKITRNEVKGIFIYSACMISVSTSLILIVIIMDIYYKRMNKQEHSNVASKYPSTRIDNDNDEECAMEKLNPNREYAYISRKLKKIDA